MKKSLLTLLVTFFVVMSLTAEAGACCCRCCSKSTKSRILDACKEVTEIFLNREGAHYSCGNDIIWGDIVKTVDEGVGICSPTYVSMVLYVSGLLTENQINKFNYNWCGDGGLPSMLESAGWIQLDSSQAQPGDVLVKYEFDAKIYAGKGRCWDQNSCIGQATGKSYKTEITDYSVYRAPKRRKRNKIWCSFKR